MKIKPRNILWGLALLSVACVLLASGCSTTALGASRGKGPGNQAETPSTGAQNPNSEPSNNRTVEVTLYFSDDQAMEVLPEKRTVEVTEDEAQMPIEKMRLSS